MDSLRIILILTLIFGFGCSSVKVSTDAYQDFSIENYSTYDYHIHDRGQIDSVLIFEDEIEFLRNILDDHLNSFDLIHDGDPELRIYVGYVPEDKYTLMKESGYEVNYAGDIKSSRDRGDLVEAYYQMGALTVDFVDMSRNQVVFSMTATNTLRRNERKNQERIETAIRKMFLDMPKK